MNFNGSEALKRGLAAVVPRDGASGEVHLATERPIILLWSDGRIVGRSTLLIVLFVYIEILSCNGCKFMKI